MRNLSSKIEHRLSNLIQQQIDTLQKETPLSHEDLFEFQLRILEIENLFEARGRVKPLAPWPVRAKHPPTFL
jgi:hypothetical protein